MSLKNNYSRFSQMEPGHRQQWTALEVQTLLDIVLDFRVMVMLDDRSQRHTDVFALVTRELSRRDVVKT